MPPIKTRRKAANPCHKLTWRILTIIRTGMTIPAMNNPAEMTMQRRGMYFSMTPLSLRVNAASSSLG